jgi:hypothetical protein
MPLAQKHTLSDHFLLKGIPASKDYTVDRP